MLPIKAGIFAYRDQSFHLFVGQSDFFFLDHMSLPQGQALQMKCLWVHVKAVH